jgi:hypothetical protein
MRAPAAGAATHVGAVLGVVVAVLAASPAAASATRAANLTGTPAPPILPALSCEEKPSTTPVATAPEEKNCDVCSIAAVVACWCGCQSWNPMFRLMMGQPWAMILMAH